MANQKPSNEKFQMVADDTSASSDEHEERISRDQEMRGLFYNEEDAYSDDIDNWTPDKGILDASKFPPRPGFTQRWVRTKLVGIDDPRNIARRMNEGYRPRHGSTLPVGIMAPTIQFRGSDGVIGIDGMVLMERPLKLHEKAAAYHREQTQRQMAAVESNLMQSHQSGSGFGAPRLSSATDVETGRRTAPVADDRHAQSQIFPFSLQRGNTPWLT